MIRNVEPWIKRVGEKPAYTISIDVDGVLAKSAQRAIALHTMEGGLPVTFSDIKDYDMRKFLRYPDGSQITGEHLKELFEKAWAEPERIEIFHPNAKGLLNNGLGGNAIRIVTAGWGEPEKVREFLRLDKIFYDDMKMVGGEDEKLSVVGDIHLDDRPATAIAVSNAGKESFLLGSPYMGPIDVLRNNNVHVARDWPHFGLMVMSGQFDRP